MYSPKIGKRNVDSIGRGGARSLREKVFRDNKGLDTGGLNVKSMVVWRTRQTGNQDSNLSKTNSYSSCDLSSGGHSPDSRNAGKSLLDPWVEVPSRKKGHPGTNLTKTFSSSFQDVRQAVQNDNPEFKSSGRMDDFHSPNMRRKQRDWNTQKSNLSFMSKGVSSSTSDLRGIGARDNPSFQYSGPPDGTRNGSQSKQGGRNQQRNWKDNNMRNGRSNLSNMPKGISASTCDLSRGIGGDDSQLSPGKGPRKGWETSNLSKVGYSASTCDLRDAGSYDSAPRSPKKSRRGPRKRRNRSNLTSVGSASSCDLTSMDDNSNWKTGSQSQRTNLTSVVSASSVDLRHAGWDGSSHGHERPNSLLLSPEAPGLRYVSYSEAVKMGSQTNLSQMRSVSSFDLRDIGRMDSPYGDVRLDNNLRRNENKTWGSPSGGIGGGPRSKVPNNKNGQRRNGAFDGAPSKYTRNNQQNRRRTYSECKPSEERQTLAEFIIKDPKPWKKNKQGRDSKANDRRSPDENTDTRKDNIVFVDRVSDSNAKGTNDTSISAPKRETPSSKQTKGNGNVKDVRKSRTSPPSSPKAAQKSGTPSRSSPKGARKRVKEPSWRVTEEGKGAEWQEKKEPADKGLITPTEEEAIVNALGTIKLSDGHGLMASTDTEDFDLSDRVRREIMDVKCQIKLSAIPTAPRRLSLTPSLVSSNLDIMIKASDMLKDSIEAQVTELEDLRKGTKDMFSCLEHTDSMLAKIEARFGDMKKKNLRNELASMKNNVLILGMHEIDNECVEDTVRRFFQKRIGLECGSLTKTCRVGYPKPGVDRAIRVTFPSYRDKELIKRAKFRLKGTHYIVCDEYPREIEMHRKKLYPVLREARREGKNTKLKVDTLFIDGSVYKGAGPGPLGYKTCNGKEVLSLSDESCSDTEA